MADSQAVRALTGCEEDLNKALSTSKMAFLISVDGRSTGQKVFIVCCQRQAAATSTESFHRNGARQLKARPPLV